uniref:8.9 kDa family member n=1 Tax=Rhipicephalus appendiculatus TaxID=34631 RepID=A0A131YTY7_RHIAP
MLTNEIFLSWLLGLSLSEAVNYHPVKIVPLVGIHTKGTQCRHSFWYFNKTVDETKRCGRLSCYPEDKVVVKMECATPPAGCYPDAAPRAHFPYCCRVTCPSINVCVTEQGVVMLNGTSLNLTEPCVRYRCQHGILTKEVCPIYDDPKCGPSFVDRKSPYPACCGVGRACEDGTNKRMKRSNLRVDYHELNIGDW